MDRRRKGLKGKLVTKKAAESKAFSVGEEPLFWPNNGVISDVERAYRKTDMIRNCLLFSF